MRQGGLVIVFLRHRRWHAAARRMREAGCPEHAIARALRIKRERLSQVLAGRGLWGGLAQTIRDEMRRAA